jgi:hypothetical protein
MAGAWREKLKKRVEAWRKELKKDVDYREEKGVPFLAGTTIDRTCKEVSAALARRLGNLSDRSASATLSIKIQKVRQGGSDFEFTVFGIRADAGVARESIRTFILC